MFSRTIFTLLLCVSTIFMGSVAHTAAFDSVQNTLEITKQQTQAKAGALTSAMLKEQQELRGQRNALAAEVAARKAKAESLQEEFTALKLEEDNLEQELAGKKDMMDSIRSTISNNANLFLQSAPTYISSNFLPEQKEILEKLVSSKDFPKLLSIETLLTNLQTSIYKSGEIQKNQEKIFTRDGQEVTAEVLHLGAFQSYFSYNGEWGFTLRTRLLEPLEMTPYVANDLEAESLRLAFSGTYTLPLDVSNGELLLSPPKQYSLWITIQESGLFGWCIIGIGLIGFLLVIERYIALSRVKLQGEQLAQEVTAAQYDEAKLATSPSGRVIKQMLQGDDSQKVCLKNTMDSNLLERRAEEAMLKELPALEKFLNTIRIFAAVSPLLGLLGTVSGIVATFRIITAYGNSDPKLLSGGISEALLTTEMGLLAAIPLLLAHHFLNRRLNNIILDMELASTIVIRHYTKAA